MKSGQLLLIETLRDSLCLAKYNPCMASDATLLALARGIKAFLSSEVDLDLSREKTARFLGMSTRSLGRKVKEGAVPKPERRGHKALSFPAMSIAKLVRRIREKEEPEVEASGTVAGKRTSTNASGTVAGTEGKTSGTVEKPRERWQG